MMPMTPMYMMGGGKVASSLGQQMLNMPMLMQQQHQQPGQQQQQQQQRQPGGAATTGDSHPMGAAAPFLQQLMQMQQFQQQQLQQQQQRQAAGMTMANAGAGHPAFSATLQPATQPQGDHFPLPAGYAAAPDTSNHGDGDAAGQLVPADADAASSGRPHRLITLVNGRRMHVCSVCKKMFGWSSNLRRHMRVHTGRPPGVCVEVCVEV